MNAIPTMYKGLRFRSRLEATWAAFFDELRIEWEYEPIDLAGYIPDFVISQPGVPILVEVKPAIELAELHQHVAKIERSGWTHRSLLVGARLFDTDFYVRVGISTPDVHYAQTHPILSFDEALPPHQRAQWRGARFDWCNNHDSRRFYLSNPEQQCPWCGEQWTCFNPDQRSEGHVLRAWASAKNASQWRGRGDAR